VDLGRAVKGIFDTKANSGYDDEILRRYHFPPQYRGVAERLVGDWIIYREPQRNGGRRAYVAAAKVLRIEPDPVRPGYSFALIGDYLPFDRPLPFASGGAYAEAALREIGDPTRVGAYLQGKSIRTVSEVDFVAIVRAGLDETLDPENALRLELDPLHVDAETLGILRASAEEQARRIEQILLNRKGPRGQFPSPNLRRLRQPMRRDWAAHRERRRKGRSPTGAHMVGRFGRP